VCDFSQFPNGWLLFLGGNALGGCVVHHGPKRKGGVTDAWLRPRGEGKPICSDARERLQQVRTLKESSEK